MDIKPISLASIIDNIDISNKNNKSIIDTIDKNDDEKNSNRFALKEGYEPRNAEATAAISICNALHDCQNYALHFAIIKRIGPSEAYRLLQETQDDCREASKIGKKINKPAALYNWKFGRLLRKVKK